MENGSARNSGLSPKTLRLVESAVMLALATALSLVKIYQMPLGGSVTLCSMLPVLLIAYKYGPKWGLLTGFTYSVIQLLLDLSAVLSYGLTPTAVTVSFLLDYLAAFTFLGLAGVYGKGFWRFLGGMTTAVVLRYLAHVVAGATAYVSFVPPEWGVHAWAYSFAYNAFLLPDFILCAVVGVLIFRPLNRFLQAA